MITSISTTIAPSATSSMQPTVPAGSSDQNDDPVKKSHARHGHGGGHMLSAVSQALQSLGLTLPTGAPAATSSNSSPAGPSVGTGSSSSSQVKNDLRQFMHQLFEAVKAGGAASQPSDASGAPSSGDAQAGFAAGLSALITQVSGGTAPAALQGAFAQLSSDLAPAAVSSSSAGSSRGQATLQAFLTNLQQDLGYGQTSASATGSLVTAQG